MTSENEKRILFEDISNWYLESPKFEKTESLTLPMCCTRYNFRINNPNLGPKNSFKAEKCIKDFKFSSQSRFVKLPFQISIKTFSKTEYLDEHLLRPVIWKEVNFGESRASQIVLGQIFVLICAPFFRMTSWIEVNNSYFPGAIYLKAENCADSNSKFELC